MAALRRGGRLGRGYSRRWAKPVDDERRERKREVKGEERSGVDWHGGCGGEERALDQFQHSVFGHFCRRGSMCGTERCVEVKAKVKVKVTDAKRGPLFSTRRPHWGVPGSYFFGVASVSLAGAYD